MKIKAADLFCGAGGTSAGLLSACKQLRREVDLLAINHWNIAIDTHTLNHPGARHLCESLDNVDPRKTVPLGKLDILCASPECTHHSIARGGKPRSDQSRATAWHILRWAEALRIENILIENVREFQQWGPLAKTGKPMKSKRGHTYQAFLAALRSLDYVVEERIINAADFGDATTRQRLFIMAWRRGGKVAWPEPSHIGRWKPARDIIDWSIKGKSIFNRKRPLSANTLRRIEAGLRKFGGEAFLVKLRGTEDSHLNNGAQSVGSPVPTITAGGLHFGVAQPFLMHVTHHGKRPGHSVDKPLPTITCAKRGEMALIEPFLVRTDQTGANGICAHSIDGPAPTIDCRGALGVVEPFLVKYYSTGGAHPVSEPMDSITTRDRFALVEDKSAGSRLDIHFRMLQPAELAGAMGFPPDYQFTGSRESQVKQIGNAVPVRTAAALCKALLK